MAMDIIDRLHEAVKASGINRKTIARRVHGTASVLHPLADDSLDPRVDDESLALVNASDFASSIVVSELQSRIRAF